MVAGADERTPGVLATAVALVSVACASVGCGDDCPLFGAKGATTGTLTRAGTSIDLQNAQTLDPQDRSPTTKAIHGALDAPTDASGDLAWTSDFADGTFAIAIRFPVTEGASIPFASEPLANAASFDFLDAGEVTGASGAATSLRIAASAQSFVSTAAAGTVTIVDDDPLVLDIACDYEDAKAGETVELHAELTLEPTEEHDPNCN